MCKDTSVGLSVSKRTVRKTDPRDAVTVRNVRRQACLVILAGVFLGIGRDGFGQDVARDWRAPIAIADRCSWDTVRLTDIGRFGEPRKPRPGVPTHLHTGIDIRRPSGSYDHEPIFAAAAGTVVSVRDDGPFAQILVEHHPSPGDTVWTVYEHVAGIRVSLGDPVGPDTVLARFMTIAELERHGWQFDHVHFEVMKERPPTLTPTEKLPQRRFGTYALLCYTREQLEQRYHDPFEYLERRWSEADMPRSGESHSAPPQ